LDDQIGWLRSQDLPTLPMATIDAYSSNFDLISDETENSEEDAAQCN